MCGIAGLVGVQGDTRLLPLAEAMGCTLSHRGPDDSGSFFAAGDGIALSHRRLAVLDTSHAGRQPFTYTGPAGTVTIVYNGEVYNYCEIRDVLTDAGYTFSTGTDTEVVAAALSAWGVAALPQFNGMFALALYDHAAGTLLLARDRFGVKPLYLWTPPHGGLAFASEIKAFTVVPGWAAKANLPRVQDYLATGSLDTTRETLFTGVYQVQGGESLLIPLRGSGWGDGTWWRAPPRREACWDDIPGLMTRWYRPPQGDVPSGPPTYGLATQSVRDILTDAVRLRLRSDVPVGSCLSGGIDSTTVVALVAQTVHTPARQVTVSGRAPGSPLDEGTWIVTARSAAPRAEGLETSVTRPAERIPAVVWAQDEPPASGSVLLQDAVFAMARDHGIIVMLDGQGADELFGGYLSVFPALFRDRIARRRVASLLWECAWALARHTGKNAISPLARSFMKGVLFRRGGIASVYPWIDGSRVLQGEDASGGRERLTRESVPRPLPAFLALTHSETSLPVLLHYADRSSMAHGVEARLPFLDYRLVEYVSSLPGEYRVTRGWTKRILRSATKGLIPDAIRCRIDKVGFAAPDEDWVRESPAVYRTYIASAIARSDGYIGDGILRYFDDVVGGTARYDGILWRTAMLGAWADIFSVEFPPGPDVSTDGKEIDT